MNKKISLIKGAETILTEKENNRFEIKISSVNFSFHSLINFEPSKSFLENVTDELWQQEKNYEDVLNERYKPIVEKYEQQGCQINFWYQKSTNAIITFYIRILYDYFYYCTEQYKAFEIKEIESICNNTIKQKQIVY